MLVKCTHVSWVRRVRTQNTCVCTDNTCVYLVGVLESTAHTHMDPMTCEIIIPYLSVMAVAPKNEEASLCNITSQ